MMFHSAPLFATFLLLARVVVTHAYPYGAPNCVVGVPAPGAFHRVDRNPQIGSLESLGFIATLNGTTLDNSTTLTFQANQEIKVVVTSVNGSRPFKGALIIVSKPNRTISNVFSLSEAERGKLNISTACPFDARDGVTQIDDSLKTSVEATMVFQKNYVDLLFDVNIVVINKEIFAGGSFFYHTQYKINVVGGPPTPPPTSSPTLAPISAPTVRPCGLFGLSIFCPFTFCGFFGRLLFGSRDC